MNGLRTAAAAAVTRTTKRTTTTRTMMTSFRERHRSRSPLARDRKPGPPPSSSSSSSSLPSPGRLYLNDPSSVAPIRIDVDSASTEDRDAQIEAAVREICPLLFSGDGDKSVQGGDGSSTGDRRRPKKPTMRSLSIRELGGGLSNRLFVVSVAADATEDGSGGGSVLVRVHDGDDNGDGEGNGDGDECEAFVDREFENRILAHLSRLGMAPTFYGRFLNGRVEEFYVGCRPLSFEELSLPKYAGKVAEALASLHNIEVPEEVLPISERESGSGDKDVEEEKAGTIWRRVDRWFVMAGDGAEAQARVNDDPRAVLLEEMREEWAWLKAELLRRDEGADDANENGAQDGSEHPLPSASRSLANSFLRQVVFAHMDCQSLNILTPDSADQVSSTSLLPSSAASAEKEEEEATIFLIDFEYASRNRRAVDLANTFCEHCDMNNLSANYQSQYPSPERQDYFLKRYVRMADPDLASQLDLGEGGNEDGTRGARIDGGMVSRWDEFLSEAREYVGRHALVSHLGWAVWALAQERRSGIEYDFAAYARMRMEGYRLFKSWFWNR